MKIYLASPLTEKYRKTLNDAQGILIDKGFDVYVPVTKCIEHAWEWPKKHRRKK